VPRASSDLLALDWDTFLDYFEKRWEPGQHFSLSALTGTGKSTFMAGVLNRCRRFVLGLDVKGGDEILEALGWPRLEEMPSVREMARTVRRNLDAGRPNRFVVGPVVQRTADRPKRLAAISKAIEVAFDMGGWTLYIDELQIAGDRRMMDLGDEIAELLVSARQPKRISVASSFQAPSWVPLEAVRQPYWIGTSVTRDEQMVQRLAEAIGRDYHEVLGAMRGMDEHWFLVVDRNPHSPLVFTKPRKLA
jgi:hypothetical protein